MKISALPATGIPTPQAVQENQPAQRPGVLRMVTNNTPGAAEIPQQELPISSTNETSAVVEATQPVSPQVASLAKRQRALQLKERELLAREKAIQQKPGNSVVDLARLKAEPLSVMLESGVTYDQLTEAIMAGQGGTNEVRALKTELQTLKDEMNKRFEAEKLQARREALINIREDVKELVKEDENFELIKELRQENEVVKLIDVYHRKTGRLLDFKTACEWVEEQLLEDNKNLAGLKKMQKLFTPQPVTREQRQMGMRTLTNKDTASPQLSPKSRALAAFYGTLRK
jgi:hypothetical protein